MGYPDCLLISFSPYGKCLGEILKRRKEFFRLTASTVLLHLFLCSVAFRQNIMMVGA